MSFTPSQRPRYERLEVSPISEAHVDELPEILDVIDAHLAQQAEPFEPVVVHGAETSHVRQCVDLMDAHKPFWHRHKANRMAGNKSLHQDSGRVVDLSVHYTLQGNTDFVFLPDTTFRAAWLRPKITKAMAMAGHLIYDHGLIDARIAVSPTTALTATLGEGDLLLFDHTYPHATLNGSEDRESTVYYNETRLPWG